jgi:hypothetical protein
MRDPKQVYNRGVPFHIVDRLQTVGPAVDVDDSLSDGFDEAERLKGFR